MISKDLEIIDNYFDSFNGMSVLLMALLGLVFASGWFIYTKLTDGMSEMERS